MDHEKIKPVLLRNWKQVFDYLYDPVISTDFKAENYNGKQKNYLHIVKEYNRLKERVSKNQ